MKYAHESGDVRMATLRTFSTTQVGSIEVRVLVKEYSMARSTDERFMSTVARVAVDKVSWCGNSGMRSKWMPLESATTLANRYASVARQGELIRAMRAALPRAPQDRILAAVDVARLYASSLIEDMDEEEWR